VRIPQAADIFGNRVAEVTPATALPEGPDYIGQGLQDLSAGFTHIANQEMARETEEVLTARRELKAERDRIEREAKAKAEQAEKEKQHAQMQNTILSYKGAMAEMADTIWQDKNIPGDEKLEKLNEAAEKMKGLYTEDFGDKAYLLEPVHTEALLNAKHSIYNLQEKQAIDTARASTLTVLQDLERRAAISPKDRAEAVRILNSIDWTGFNEQEKEKYAQEFKERTATIEIDNRINKNDLNGVLKDLKAKSKDGNPLYLPDMDPKSREHYIGAIENAIEQEKRQREAAAKAAKAERKDNIRDFLDVYEQKKLAGMPINPKDEVMIAKAVREFPALAEKFKGIKQKGESLAFRTEQFAKDPLTFGAGTLGIEIEPLNMQDPALLTKQLQNRAEIGKQIKAAYNMPYTPILKPAEAAGLAGMMKTEKDGGTQLLNKLQESVGKDGMMSIAQQITTEDDQAGMFIGLFAAGKTATAKMLAEGTRYLKEKAVRLPKETDMRSQFDGMIGDALLGMPQNQETHYKAFQSYYAALAGRKGDTLGESVDRKRAESAFTAIVGDIARINGKKLVLPEGYTEGKFINSVKQIDAGFIGKLSGGGVQGMTNEDAAEVIRDDARWHVTSRPNTYRPEVDGRYLLKKDGTILEVMFK